jgi:hypothetical protein
MSNFFQVRLQAGSFAAWLATCLLWVPAVVAVTLYFGWTGPDYPSYDSIKYQSKLDVQYLVRLWQYRRDIFGHLLAIDFFACMGLFFSFYSILCVSKIYKFSGGAIKKIMLYSYLVGAVLPVIEFLQNMGGYTEAYNLSLYIADLKDNASSYASLEISFRLAQAQSVWVYSMIYLAIGLSLLCSSYLFWKEDKFRSRPHAILGVIVAVIGFVAFSVEASTFFDEALRTVFGVVTLFWGVGCFPAWLMILGWRLNKYVVTERHTQLDDNTDAPPIEMEATMSV